MKFEDEPRSERPKTVSTNENASKIKGLIWQNRKISIKNIAKITGINRESISQMLIKELQMKKLKPVKLPHKLTQEMKDERLDWCKWILQTYPDAGSMDSIVTGDETYLFYEQNHGGKEWRGIDEDTPRIPKMMRYTSKKRMFYIFFNRHGLVHFTSRKLNKSATGINYKLQISRVIKKIGSDRSKIIIHDDNAPIHRSNVVKKYYERTGETRLTHPRYSPDLAPNDFWLIRKLKRAMDDQYIPGERKLHLEALKILKNILPEEYAMCYEVWRERMKKCIEIGGDYFEYRKRRTKRKRKNK